MKRYEHHQLKYMKDRGNLSFWSAKRAKRVLMVLWFIHISKTVHFTAVKRDYVKGVHFQSKMVYKPIGWTSGRSLPV